MLLLLSLYMLLLHGTHDFAGVAYLLLALYCYWHTCSFPCSCCCWHPCCCRCFLFVVGPIVTGVHDLAIVHDVAGIPAVAGVSSVVDPLLASVLIVLLHSLAATHAVARVSAVVGPTGAGVVA
jgi:hypothetical protein